MTEIRPSAEMSCVSKKSQTTDIVQNNPPIKIHPPSQTVREFCCKDRRVETFVNMSSGESKGDILTQRPLGVAHCLVFRYPT